MARKKQSWEVGDVFTVRTSDGKLVLGQVVGQEPKALNSATLAFYDVRVDTEEQAKRIRTLDANKAFSVVFATRDLLDSGTWRIVGKAPIGINREDLPYEDLRDSGFVGVKIIGSGNLEEFLNAFYGLAPWDDWKDPQYLDRLLFSPSKKPTKLIFKKTVK